ncbi:hypothetical protein PFISCL1PPCAC_27917 [Pristionchus fissidentatus]|uniref:Uncharacterized protein n=1 Tax=Pristionchus fissidentatus TaxID=1538716 RepID=A0AAV5WYP7_9BILA|nr:hypothetical protein PFISCL1PPCAC_27917 [Pristionchus fissidentatus]
MQRIFLLCLLVAVVAFTATAAMDMGDEEAYNRLANAYRAILYKSKRSPSMGLSLAEYMASPKGGENFHFIPSGRK